MKVSLIVAIYRDLEALKLILDSLSLQSYSYFEVIVAEDANDKKVERILSNYPHLCIKHCSQEDEGIRKMRSQNNAIKAATGELLIFIDGDCIPYTNFIEHHVISSETGYALSGRRVNLGEWFSDKLRKRKLSAEYLEKFYAFFFVPLLIDGKEGHMEGGFVFNPRNWFYRNLIAKRNRTTSLLGCNFSCFKSDILKVNGFDESYGETAIGDDTDLEWRLIASGVKIKSVKNCANVFHLYHKKRDRVIPYYPEMLELMAERKARGAYIAHKGLDSSSD